ncbi:lipopolysaccharide biosynthesis protein [uncultured Butyricimonas sp.]|uniref:lipopolysaccharide biosynthesis protein n=1 Tax=uncultured Butyricimonas sp. TaxID=1268785 RepID=UPI0026DAE7C1|nr:oligosaccharide flippase family protein [uncultured Butyricimonas sp.]
MTKVFFNKIIKEFILKLLPKRYYKYYVAIDQRSQLILKNALITMTMKVANLLSMLLIVPITIDYVDSEKYGIWLTISSIIGWITFFDLGFGHGFRNKFAEAKANRDYKLARKYVSTTYFSVACIVLVLLIFLFIANRYINWCEFLRLSNNLQFELKKVFEIVVIFTSLTMIANVFNSLLAADMKPGVTSIINGISQYAVLIVLFVLTRNTKGSLVDLAFVSSVIPFMMLFVVSLLVFKYSRYKIYSPSFRFIEFSQIKSIASLGIQFAIIQVSLIAIFQVINLVITRELGPSAVSQYSISNRYFSILYMVLNMILAPVWSAFTDAYTKKDYMWMRKTFRRLERLNYLFVVILFFMFLLSGPVYKIWIDGKIFIPTILSFSMMILIMVQCFASTYMMCLNGIGHIRIQLLIYVICAIISWPVLTMSARYLGLVAVTMIPTFVYLLQAVFGRIQLNRIINNSARGIWIK